MMGEAAKKSFHSHIAKSADGVFLRIQIFLLKEIPYRLESCVLLLKYTIIQYEHQLYLLRQHDR